MDKIFPSWPQGPLAGGCGPGATGTNGQQHCWPYVLRSDVDMQHIDHIATLSLSLKRLSFPKPTDVFGHPQSPTWLPHVSTTLLSL